MNKSDQTKSMLKEYLKGIKSVHYWKWEKFNSRNSSFLNIRLHGHIVVSPLVALMQSQMEKENW